MLIGLLATTTANAQTWNSGRGTGTSSGQAVTVDVNTDTGEEFNTQGAPHNQFQAANITFSATGGGGSTGGGVSPASGSSNLGLSTNLTITAGVQSLRAGVTELTIGVVGTSTFVGSVPLGFYPFPARRDLRGSAGSSALLDQLQITVTGAEPVLFEFRATGDFTSLLDTVSLSPLSPGAEVIGNTLLPGVYGLPNIAVGVNQGSGPGPFRTSFDGRFSVVLGVPEPGTGVIIGAALLRLGRRRRTGSRV